jgi:hypothetical protein
VVSEFKSQFLVQVISINNVIRSDNLEAKLTEFGIDYVIPPEVVPDLNDFQSGLLHSAPLSKLICQRSLSIGDVGCALAHRAAMTNLLNSEHKFGIFFEDDAEVLAEFDFDILAELLDSRVPTIIALGWIPGFAISKDPKIPLREELIELVTSPTCTFAYSMNRSAAKLMIDSHEKIMDLPDWPIYTLNKVKFYSTQRPWVTANHDPKLSTIGVRSTPTSNSLFGVLVSRVKLASSLLALIVLSKTNKLDVSLRQIVHRMLLRGLLYKYGASQVVEKSLTYEIVPFPLKYMRLLKWFELN